MSAAVALPRPAWRTIMLEAPSRSKWIARMKDVESIFSSIELAPIARGIAGLSSGEPYVMSVESPLAGVAARSAVLRIMGWIYSRGPALAGLVIKGPVRE